jgi:hypothetical protein
MRLPLRALTIRLPFIARGGGGVPRDGESGCGQETGGERAGYVKQPVHTTLYHACAHGASHTRRRALTKLKADTVAEIKCLELPCASSSCAAAERQQHQQCSRSRGHSRSARHVHHARSRLLGPIATAPFLGVHRFAHSRHESHGCNARRPGRWCRLHAWALVRTAPRGGSCCVCTAAPCYRGR